MKKMLAAKINLALDRIGSAQGSLPAFVVEEPRDPDHGHLATNVALTMSKVFKKKPTELASLILEQIDNSEGYIESSSVAGPGFINFTLSSKWWAKALGNLLKADSEYGRGSSKGIKIMVEYVSANPTGPLHVGHGRGAAIGDALGRVMAYAGYDVTREYYINDAGRQMLILGESVLYRIREINNLQEEDSFPANYYQGQYIVDLAREAHKKWPDILEMPPEEAVNLLTVMASDSILDGIKADLDAFKVGHEVWFSEKKLYEDGLVDEALKFLGEQEQTYSKDGALWFKTEAFGDDKDRVLIKSGGEKTYFAADIAYHRDKFQRGFDLVIDIWGADHHGYISRMKAAVEALGRSRDDLGVVLVQLVSLVKGGQPVAMSTRAGEFVTLKEVVDEVGADAARFIFLTRSPDTTLEFDLDLAKSQTKDNPVYYVQYVGARIESILKAAQTTTQAGVVDLELLSQPQESALIKHLTSFPELVQTAAFKREPHLLTIYLTTLARLFHHYYGKHRINVDEAAIATARLTLIKAIRLVVARGLNLLGVNSPDSM